MADLGVAGTFYQPRVPITGTDSVYYTMPKTGIYLGVWGLYNVGVVVSPGTDSVYWTVRKPAAGNPLGKGTPGPVMGVSFGPGSVCYLPRQTRLGLGRRAATTYLSAARPGSVFYTLTQTRAYVWNGSRWVSGDAVSIWNGTRWVPLAEFTAWDGAAWVRP